MEFGGYISGNAVGETLTVKIKAGSVVVGTTGAAATNGGTDQAARLYALITCRTAGVTGTFQVDTIFETTTNSATPTNAPTSKIINTSNVVLDTTGTLAWDITAQWDTADLVNTITGKTFAMFTPGTGPQGAAGPTGPTGPAASGIFSCQPGLGDGLNAITAGTYLQSGCFNQFGVTYTITSIKCYTDNNGTSTLNVTNGAGTALLTGAITCTNTIPGAAGTQGATTTIVNGDGAKFSFVADGTTKQATWSLTGTR